MGDEAKTNRRKPVSLNDRHYRFLLELSAPQKPTAAAATHSSSSASGQEVNPPKARLEGRRRLCKASTSSSSATETEGYGGGCGDDEDDGPQFGLANFNSPLEDEVQKKLNVNLEGSKEDVCKVLTGEPESSGDDAIPQFPGIVNFDYPDAEEEEKRSMVNPQGLQDPLKDLAKETLDNGDDDIQKFIDSASPEEKLRMVKVVGRRRLCKLSSQEHDNAGTGALDDGALDFNDFDSPFPSQNRGDGVSNPGVGEIRDILHDLTSRLDLLSIEKSRVPRDMKRNCDEPMGCVQDGGQDKVDAPEYASAGSSFSSRSNPSNSSSDETKGVIGDFDNAVYEFNQANNLLSGAEDDYFGDKVHDSKNNEGLRKNECARLDGELTSVGKSCVPNIEEEQCSIQRDSDGDDYSTRVQRAKKSTLRSNNDDPKRVHEKLRYAGRSYLHLLRDQDQEDEDEQDDCVVLSGKHVVKETGTHAVRHKQYPDPSSVVDVLDDETDKSVLEDEGVFTLSGLKLSYKLPGKIANMLYPHQREGLKWLWSLHCQGKGGILGDDMGLGKTMQICGFLAGLFHSRLIRRALVVAPKTLLPHWIKELSAVGLSGKTREYFGTSIKAREYELQYIFQDKGVLLTTYDIVRNNSKSLRGNHYFADEDCEGGFPWDYMILDEGHLIKNPSTQRAKSLLEIPCAHRVIISGTPIQNNLKELWALFNFCCPDLLGDKKWFKDRFENPILRGNEKNASDRDKRIGSTVAKELRERIQPYFLRRLKNEVFEGDDDTTVKLSKKNEIIVWLKLTSCQRQLYEAFLRSEIVLSAFDGSPLAALTILKKICDHPLLLTRRAAEDVLEGMDSILNPEDARIAEKLAMHVADVTQEANFEENHDNVSCKISFILSLLDNLIPEGHKVLIFSQTRKMLNLIQESLLSSGYEFLRIDGTTKAIDRVKIVDDFQKGNGPPIFLLTSQVGGLGLTLTEADRVIVVDPAWNPSTDNQSVDRAYRIGQKKDVIVYRLMTCGTVEEKIYRKQIFKGGLFKTATEHKEQIRYFSQQDLRELFSLPKQGFDVSLTQQQLHEEHDGRHKMDEALETHIKFLETRGIAGVSHHSLLFSKTAPEQAVHEEEEEIRRKPTSTFCRNSSSSYLVEHDIDAAMHAFKPKDVQLNRKVSSPDSVGKLTESDIKERINRLSQILSNKATVSRLPDGGAKLQKQISELNSELCKMKEKENVKQVIELDDLTGELQRVLNV